MTEMVWDANDLLVPYNGSAEDVPPYRLAEDVPVAALRNIAEGLP